MTSRERATDRLGIVHSLHEASFAFLETACRIKSRWSDKFPKPFSHNVMTWDGFDPLPDVTCMACLVIEARR